MEKSTQHGLIAIDGHFLYGDKCVVKRPARGLWSAAAAIIAGVVLLIIGTMGLVLPILPGWLLIGAGVILLAPHVSFCRRLIRTVAVRCPVLQRYLPKNGDPPA